MKVKYLHLSGKVLAHLLGRQQIHNLVIGANGLPVDAKIITAEMVLGTEGEANGIALLIESEEFPDVPAGEEPDTMEPITVHNIPMLETLCKISAGQDDRDFLNRDEMRRMATRTASDVLRAAGRMQ